MKALQQVFVEPHHKTALLVIDEESHGNYSAEISDNPGLLHRDSNVTACQQRLLLYMQHMQCDIWSTRFIQGINSDIEKHASGNTRLALKAYLNVLQCFLNKLECNAFNNTHLHYELKHRRVTHIVVMGFHANVCILRTIGSPFFGKGWDDGAAHLGYEVLTCNAILHGGPAYWSQIITGFDYDKKLKFYTQF